MADLTITAASVVPSDGYVATTGVAGETITRGQTLYLKAADTRYWKADANASSATAAVAGISLSDAAAGQACLVMTGGSITIGATITAGLIYVNSATAGGIAPSADLVTGWRTSILGVATSTTVLALKINNSDTALA